LGLLADPEILKGGGGGSQRISPVVIYHKCTQQRNVCLLHGKRWLFEKQIWTSRGSAAPTQWYFSFKNQFSFQLLFYVL